jgi:hypothetical protein
VLRRLDDVHAVRVFGAGAAVTVLTGQAPVESIEPYAPGPGMARAFGTRFLEDRGRLRAVAPRLVVSDGDGPSVHAAWSLGIPVLAVGHGMVFRHARLPSGLPLTGRFREAINAGSSSWPAKRRVVVHFAPAEPATRGTVIARPDLDPSGCVARQREDFVLAYFRDDDGMGALAALAARGHRVVWFGTPGRAPRGVEVLPPDVEAFRDALTRCRAVVGSAGNHLPAECAMMGIPMLAMHRRGDAEHAMNARLIEAEGIGVASAFSKLDTRVLQRFEAELDRDRSALMRRIRAMPPASEVVSRFIDEMSRPTRARLTPRAYAGAAASAR